MTWNRFIGCGARRAKLNSEGIRAGVPQRIEARVLKVWGPQEKQKLSKEDNFRSRSGLDH